MFELNSEPVSFLVYLKPQCTDRPTTVAPHLCWDTLQACREFEGSSGGRSEGRRACNTLITDCSPHTALHCAPHLTTPSSTPLYSTPHITARPAAAVHLANCFMIPWQFSSLHSQDCRAYSVGPTVYIRHRRNNSKKAGEGDTAGRLTGTLQVGWMEACGVVASPACSLQAGHTWPGLGSCGRTADHSTLLEGVLQDIFV